MDDIFNNLNARVLKSRDTHCNLFDLQKNAPKVINKAHNKYTALLYEDKEAEKVYIHSLFNDDACAVIGNEFRLDYMKNSKKTDLSYYYYGTDHKAKAYLYDMKKTFAGIDVIIHLAEQWKSSILDAEYCIKKLEYSLDICDIHIGVITESNDEERRKKELEPILHPEPASSGIPSFIKHKHAADTSANIYKAALLRGFDEGKITFNGHTYKYDIRSFDKNKVHHMYFEDGILRS